MIDSSDCGRTRPADGRSGAGRAFVALVLLGTAFLSACGAMPRAPQPAAPAAATAAGQTGGPAPTATIAVAPQATTTAPAPVPDALLRFQVQRDQSTATFRVREQLAGLPFPNDAVGTTGAVTGQLVIRADGTIVAEESKVSVALADLRTDEPRRDTFIKQNTLQVQRFPFAEFVPTSASGIPSPLPSSGTHTFKLTGLMTIRSVQREVTWDVTAQRSGHSLTGTATTSFTFGHFNLTRPRVASVLSIADEIRLEVHLVATQTA